LPSTQSPVLGPLMPPVAAQGPPVVVSVGRSVPPCIQGISFDGQGEVGFILGDRGGNCDLRLLVIPEPRVPAISIST
jgi:hypothetical protein